ncbi:unnamed protein product [Cuscuta campestris]|uniref:Uncharacterized protein n=1 Tax=Cuscuta campestris TaxID=132261 RepID=A0A484KZ73_9ASTE|nr:unnamed protein product [Cuscuta campestris]
MVKKKRPPRTGTPVSYAEIPEGQKYCWIIRDDLDLLKQYCDLLEWMRSWGHRDGADFDGIRSLNVVHDFPLIEISISTPDLKPDIADRCGLTTMVSLKYSLAVLSNSNLNKILEEWEMKHERNECPTAFTSLKLDEMRERVRKLKASRWSDLVEPVLEESAGVGGGGCVSAPRKRVRI